MAVYNPPRNGTTARAVSLDLVLRTLMNSTDFHVSNNRMWDSISKMVPGTTPQQCARRWDELLLSSPSAVAGDFSGLTATGRPISGHDRKTMVKRSRSSSSQLSSEKVTGASWSADTLRVDRIDDGKGRPSSSQLRKSLSFQGTSGLWDYPANDTSKEQESRKGVGQQLGLGTYMVERQSDLHIVQAKPKIKGSFATSFCQNILSRTENNILGSRHSSSSSNDSEALEGRQPDDTSCTQSNNLDSTTKEIIKSQQDITIKVSDESKKAHQNFYCPRDILLQEMPYFQKYLSEKLIDAEISVHCDIKIFEWLINYIKKRAMKILENKNRDMPKPKMEPAQAISILISSYFLKMETLVEESLDFCHIRMSEVLETNGNLNCISQPLMTRLATKFSPIEAEEVKDKKDKIKSKLFLHQLEKMFSQEYSSPECPSNASTLYLCKHCNQLLTATQENNIPCTSERLTVSVFGKIVYNHERSLMWNVNSYIRSLQQSEGLTPRDVYWRLWGVINTLYCDRCHSHFQCWDLKGCCYHPNGCSTATDAVRGLECSCSRHSGFAILPKQKEGCCCREHHVTSSSSDSIYSIVKKFKEVICKPPIISSCYHQQQQQQAFKSCPAGSMGVPTSSAQIKSMDTALAGVLHTQQKRSLSCISPKRDATIDEAPKERAIEPMPVSPTRYSIISRQQQQPSQQQQQQQQQQLQQLQSPQHSSELEEDEEVDRKGPQHYAMATNKAKKKPHKHHKMKHNSADWVWNSTKTTTWNQDMQRENDEKRQNALFTQLSQISSIGSSSSKAEQQVPYAGGIYPRLEAQFRAQHTAKATAMQSKPLGGRKRT